ncbi:hypothetical protein [Azorhizobium doebereinerae]|uniref:hypothetical protein n=1 Tax=Azorhizobium doebereinerae TaxID=281091 RepID=UPI0004034AFA|nr:hypothetical protein [Azorhizobium doebereinerae]
MGAMTLYVVQAFERCEEGFTADEPRECRSAAHAKQVAKKLKAKKLGVIAWSRTSPDADLGEWGEPEVLARFGHIPEDFEASGVVE